MIERLTAFDPVQMERLLAESRREGFRFLARLRDEWASGTNRFDRAGEAFFGVFADGKLVGVGGITRLDDFTGRLRRFYILPSYRRRGCGRHLLRYILGHAAGHFRCVVLRTETDGGDRFYRAAGFTRIRDSHDATHRIQLQQAELATAPNRRPGSPRAASPETQSSDSQRSSASGGGR